MIFRLFLNIKTRNIVGYFIIYAILCLIKIVEGIKIKDIIS